MNVSDFITNGESLLSDLREIASLPKEFAEIGRSREKQGDEAAAGAFFSCAQRLAEILNRRKRRESAG